MYRFTDGVNTQQSRIITGNIESEFAAAQSNKQITHEYSPVSHHMGKTGAAGFSRTVPTIQDPRTSYLSLQVPNDQLILNSLYRFYDSTDPIIQNANRLHTEFPLSNMLLTDCGDPVIQTHYEEMWNDRVQGDMFLLDVGIEYNRMGNVVTFGAWNDTDFMWDKIAILNPDYIMIEDTWLAQRPLIKLRPDENLRAIVNTQKPKALFKQLHPEIIRYVQMNKDIPLHPANTWHISYNRAPYEVWGNPPVKSLLKMLFYETKLMEAQTAIAYRHIVPITLVKVGHEATGWLPDQAELQNVEQILAARELDPNMAIIYHYGINIDYVGASGKVLPVQQDLARIDEMKMMGMGISKAFLGGEGGPTYSNASVALAVLKQRYLHMTKKLSRFVGTGLFHPVADACGFYRVRQSKLGYGKTGRCKYSYGEAIYKEAQEFTKDFTKESIRDFQDNQEFKDFVVAKSAERIQKTAYKQKEYVCPEIDWNLLTLAGDLDWRRWVSEYNDKFKQGTGISFLSDSTMYRLMGLDEDAERKSVIRELRENKVRVELLAQEGITIKPAGGGSAAGLGGGDMFSGGGGGMSMPDMGAPTEEAPLGTPGEGAIPAGGEVGVMPSSSDAAMPTAHKSGIKKQSAYDEILLNIMEKDIERSLKKEISSLN